MNIPESLMTKILNGKCVLFLGAGATKESGGAVGNELGKYIYDEIGDIGIGYKENLARYTQLLVDSGYRDEIERIVRKRFSDLKPNKKFSLISEIPWKAIYTTNYDDLVEKAYKKQHFYNCIVNPNVMIPQGNVEADVFLYKMNGDINVPYNGGNPLVISLNDLRANMLKNEKMIKQLMKDLNDTFIFLGYSFQDENEIVTEILKTFQKCDRWESVKEKYVILPEISEDTELDLNSYRIRYLRGTSDEFFETVSKKAQNDYKVKMRALHNTFSSNIFLKQLQPQMLQYISERFDIFEQGRDYPIDSKNYYRGGQVNWGIVSNDFDISRDVDIKEIEDKKRDSTTDSLYLYIKEKADKNKLQKILLTGTAVSGKTTAIYRCAYDLMTNGMLSIIFKQQANYKEGILSTIYEETKQPFAIFADDIFVDITEIIKMLNEAQRNNLPLIFILSIRNADWANTLSSYNKTVLCPFDAEITMKDSFGKDEAVVFVDKLIESDLISVCNDYEKRGYVNKFQTCKNIIQVLIELIDQNRIIDSLSGEYDSLCEETKYAYGIVSLVYRYGIKVRWEVLQRVIARRFEFTWEDFIEKVLKNDAKGNLYEDKIQGNFYIWGRNRYICEMIAQIHFEGNYSDELQALKEIVKSCAGIEQDERFIGNLIHSILQDEKIEYTKDQVLDLLDYSIDILENSNNCSFINHMKGEYNLRLNDYNGAIRCFESNVQNKLNEEYSIHSLGKSYFYMAQGEDIHSGKYRMHMNLAVDRLFQGVKVYKKNPFYYGLLIQVFQYLHSNGTLSERDRRVESEVEKIAIANLGKGTYDNLLNEKLVSMD